MNDAFTDSSHARARFLAPHGRHSNIFQPPHSPAYTASSDSHDYFSSANRARKRARPESVDWTGRLPTADTPTTSPSATPAQSWIQCPTPSDAVYGSAGAVGSGAVNERYLLRDGFDTPGLMAGGLDYGRESETRSRCRMWDDGLAEGERPEGKMLTGPLARERNGIARSKSSASVPLQSQQSWTGFAFGLVGKVFSFGTGMIRGFYAGGGQGYDMQHTPVPSRGQRRPRISRASTPVPGAWQEDDFMGDFEQDNLGGTPDTASRPPNKRRQTDKDSWVMVGTPDLTDTGSSPKRKISSSSIPRSNLAPRSQASRAAGRRSLAPVSRRQSSYTASTTGSPAVAQSRQRTSGIDPPRRASFAPMRSANSSRPSSAHQEQQGYVSPDAERFVRRQAKQDRATDKAMSSMSRQLQDLIRQGQEALGTKFDVEDGDAGMDLDLDEGYVDDGDWR